MNASPIPDRRGLVFALCAYVIWGVLPLYFHLIAAVPPLQVLAHRIVWSAALLVPVVLIARRGRAIRAAARGRTMALLAASATLIALNWLVYIWAVQNGHVLEASLGYFINPLVNVALGIVILGERLRRLQGVAIGIAGLGVLTMAVSGGGAVGVSLFLAVTFGTYGLLRKIASIDALGGLTVETLLLAPAAMLWLGHSAAQGNSGFGHSLTIDAMILGLAIVTATPLLLFADAARRLPLSTLGLIQYVAPTLQFALALLLGEALLAAHLISFALIWAGCALYGWDSVRGARGPGPVRPV